MHIYTMLALRRERIIVSYSERYANRSATFGDLEVAFSLLSQTADGEPLVIPIVVRH